jgi:poly(3-hydroxybutyrate) depolymerase
MHEAPHARRHGWLRNGNSPGDLSLAPRCGAHTRAGTACCNPAMPNGKCRMHGGKSTGARTAEGRERCRTAPLKHGQRSAAVMAERQALTARLRALQLTTLALRKEAAAFIRNRSTAV